MKLSKHGRILCCLYLLYTLPATGAFASQSASGTSGQAQTERTVSAADARKDHRTAVDAEVRIGPGDELDVAVFGLPDLSQHVRVNSDGDVSLPLIGTVHVADLTSDEAEALLEQRFTSGHFVNDPHVSVYVKEYTAEGISLLGEVNRPGVYPALGAHRLLDLIQAAGGLTDKAGNTVTISHRDEQEQPTTLALAGDAARKSQSNIELLPGDTVVIAKAGIVYVVGEVNRPGGFVIERGTTASQVLAMAAGPTHLASLNRAQMIRRTPQGLQNSLLSLKTILQARSPDLPVQPGDIIYVPEGRLKGAMAASNVLGLLTSLAIYRIP